MHLHYYTTILILHLLFGSPFLDFCSKLEWQSSLSCTLSSWLQIFVGSYVLANWPGKAMHSWIHRELTASVRRVT